MQERQEVRSVSLAWEDPLEEEMASTTVFLPGKSHGQMSLAGYSLRGLEELDMTERAHTHTHTANVFKIKYLNKWMNQDEIKRFLNEKQQQQSNWIHTEDSIYLTPMRNLSWKQERSHPESLLWADLWNRRDYWCCLQRVKPPRYFPLSHIHYTSPPWHWPSFLLLGLLPSLPGQTHQKFLTQPPISNHTSGMAVCESVCAQKSSRHRYHFFSGKSDGRDTDKKHLWYEMHPQWFSNIKVKKTSEKLL